MENKWQQLRAVLNGELNERDGLSGQFFNRLLYCLDDVRAGECDRLHAFYDALQCARALGLTPLRLPYRHLTEGTMLQHFGLRRDHDYPGELLLTREAEEIDPHLLPVWKGEQRRFLETPPLDVLLPSVLNDPRYTHYTSAGQQQAVRTGLTCGRDKTLLVNLPTGSGKTFVIHSQMLTSPRRHLTLVIVPTVALAIEQALRAQEVMQQAGQDHGGRYVWHSGQSTEERNEMKSRLASGEQRALFCSPEAATGGLLLQLFSLAERGLLGAVIVDEAHLIDQWGAEFRPEFQLLAPLVRSLKATSPDGVKVVLLSATFSQSTLNTLKALFAGKRQGSVIEVNGSFLRPEPVWYVSEAASHEDHLAQVENAIARLPAPMILYTTEVEQAKFWYQYLRERGYRRCGLFHGATPMQEREGLIHAWRNDGLDIMVATSAFGVGMDKNNVRSVLHVAVPENLDRFYQESGRGGRDGKASVAHIIFHHKQLQVARNINRTKLIGASKGYLRWAKMHQLREQHQPGQFIVPLRAKHADIRMDSQSNVDWNLRTLLLMQRAGFIDIAYPPPDLSAIAPDERDEAKIRAWFDHYFNHIQVSVRRDGHMDEARWHEGIQAHRSHELGMRKQGYSALEEWLNDPSISLCQKLAQFYTLDGFVPEIACGGCPACRSKGYPPFTPTLGRIAHVTGEAVRNVMGNEQRVYYPATLTNRLLLRQWSDWIARLLANRQIQAIRASQSVLAQLSAVLPAGLPFWCSLAVDEENTCWDELVLVLPDEAMPELDIFATINRIIVAPERLQEPGYRGRRWWEVDTSAVALEQFQRNII
ncbi:DEAD/DEAH box helicase family protein [Escherichia coli P0302308.2]|uniref:protein DpdF n=1 Tax=Escherichia coli TaxID=562 RepID=UPI0002CC1423|nr:protein DpdF [Escherichia coli]END09031.1 DEAD/DEAH box helicase family protein [Escherichia coli P0302308.2]